MLSLLSTARRFPGRPALVVGGRPRSYEEVAKCVALATRQLPDLSPDAPGVAFTPQLDEASLVTLWALLERHYCAVLLHPRWTPRENERRIDLARPSLVLGPQDVSALGELARGSARRREPSSGWASASRGSEESIAAVLFSSGSTGEPKAVRLSHRAFASSAKASAANLGWRDDDRWLLCMPVAHAGGLSVITRCLLAGGAVVLHERFDPGRFLESPRLEGATLASVVPTMLRTLLEEDHHGALKGFRAILVGGAPAPEDLLRESRERGLAVLCTYGLTEACSQVATWTMTANGTARAPLRALPGLEVRVTQSHEGLAAPNVPGRLWVRGPVAMSGYGGGLEHRPEDWLDTGDVASLSADGALTVHARRRDVIITGGENVYPAEVEQVIHACAGVTGAVVFGVEDPRWGQTVAIAIATRDEAFRLDDARRALQSHLAPFKHPRLCCVVRHLPVQSVDKPNRQRIATELGAALQPWPDKA